MKIIKQQVVIESKINRNQILRKLESIGRVCYKSEDKITPVSASSFVAGIVERGHLSVIEHVSLTVKFVCDRGISHELVRHRIASYSQESTRYCNYGKQNEITVIHPGDQVEGYLDKNLWIPAATTAEDQYLAMISAGKSPQVARSVLPNCLKTEIVATCNLREWREILQQRTALAAHPDMRRLMRPLLNYLRLQLPEIFPGTLGDGSQFPPMAELVHHKDDDIVEVK